MISMFAQCNTVNDYSAAQALQRIMKKETGRTVVIVSDVMRKKFRVMTWVNAIHWGWMDDIVDIK